MRTKLLNCEGSNLIWPGPTEMARMSEPLDPKVPQMACGAAPYLPFSASGFERYVVFKTGRSDWTSSLGASVAAGFCQTIILMRLISICLGGLFTEWPFCVSFTLVFI